MRLVNPFRHELLLTYLTEHLQLQSCEIYFHIIGQFLGCGTNEVPSRGQQISWLAARSITHKFIRLYDQSIPENPTDEEYVLALKLSDGSS